MGKAEVGSAKHLSNQMKQKGLTRLRWYCQLCNKPCRDENAFKMHSQSPSHTRKALEAGSQFKETQEDFSKDFLRNFVSLLKTSHGEKEIQINRFYQEVIAERHHTHLNATKWHSLTDFAKHLGREGICRVTEKEDDGLFVAWIDDSPEATRRRETLRRKELQDKGDEEREHMLLQAQIERAQKDAKARGAAGDEEDDDAETRALRRQEGEKITDEEQPAETTQGAKPVSLKFGVKPQPKNIFKNAFSGAPKKVMAAPPKKMSEAERIMKEELEKRRAREARGGPPNKRQRL
ncbi:hypothetical protein P8C59_004167 [Phyllachora maydis]|uniref:C2H2-type domain-containing protein n=1 Tax=Phyllachora maydis TaxID=1825666 RepID=A0AAD9I310_9PEZI|nr:hypothetical protein P8C59_004167 [Phyllachora maydis]